MTHNLMDLKVSSQNRTETNALFAFDPFFSVSLFYVNSDLNTVVLYLYLTLSRGNTTRQQKLTWWNIEQRSANTAFNVF